MATLKGSTETPTEAIALPQRQDRKRKRLLDDYERRCPMGWCLDPETVALLLRDPRKNDMVPGMIPKRYPIRMTEQYVLDQLPSVMDLNGLPLINEHLAASVSRQHPSNALSIRVIYLKRDADDSIPMRWLKIRLFGDRWKYNEKQCTFKFDDVIVDVDVIALDVGWLGPSNRRALTEASVFVIVVEELDGLRRLISEIAPCLKASYPEDHCIPPFLCFTSFAQEMDVSEVETGKSGSEEEDVEQCFINAGLRVGIRVIPINRYLRRLRDQLYRSLCRKFETPSNNDDQSEDEPISDPFEETVSFLKMGLLVHAASSQH